MATTSKEAEDFQDSPAVSVESWDAEHDPRRIPLPIVQIVPVRV